MKFSLALLLGAIALTSLTACNDTWNGMGKDVEDAGQEVQASSGVNN